MDGFKATKGYFDKVNAAKSLVALARNTPVDIEDLGTVIANHKAALRKIVELKTARKEEEDRQAKTRARSQGPGGNSQKLQSPGVGNTGGGKGGQGKRGAGAFRLPLVKYQELRGEAFGDSSESSSLDSGNIGVASYKKIGPERPTHDEHQSGRDFLGHKGVEFDSVDYLDVASAAGTFSCGPFLILPVNPATWIGTRPSVEQRLYQFFRVMELELIYNSSVSTVTDGALFMAYVSDVDRSIFTAPESEFIRRLFSLQNFYTFNVWQHGAMKVKFTDAVPWAYTQMKGDSRLQTQGYIVFGCTANPDTTATLASPMPVGFLSIRSKVQMCNQVVQDNAGATYLNQSGTSFASGTAGAIAPAAGNPVTVAVNNSLLNAAFPDSDCFILTMYKISVDPGVSFTPQSKYPNASSAVLATAGTSFYAMRDGGAAGTTLRVFDHVPSSVNDDPLVWTGAGVVGTVDYQLRPVTVVVE